LGLATKFVGLDVSDGMIAQFNKFARNADIPPETMFAQQGNLLAETEPENLAGPEFFDFDLVAVGMAFHHFADPELAMKRFAARMKKGGVCLIIDLIPHQHPDMHSHPEAGPTIKRTGFGMQEMKEIFEGAGITREFDYVILEKPIVFTMDGKRRESTLFMSKARL
jgi:SAM-dependent methyltransferase